MASVLRLRLLFLGLVALCLLPFVSQHLLHVHGDVDEQISSTERQAAFDLLRGRVTFLDRKGEVEALLSGFRLLPEQRLTPEACEGLNTIIRTYRTGASTLSVALDDGAVTCSNDPGMTGAQIGKRTLFRQALAAKGIVWSDIERDPISGAYSLSAAMAVRSGGKPIYVVLANLDLAELLNDLRTALTDSDSRMLLVDGMGNVMTAYPSDAALIGRRPFADVTMSRILGLEQGQIADHSFGLGKSLVAVSRLDGTSSRLVLEEDLQSIFTEADKELATSALTLAIAVLLVVACAGLVVERVFLKSLRSLIMAAGEITAGHFSARADIRSASPELRLLGDAFNSMVERLESLAFIDGLTALPNRRHLDRHLADSARRSMRYGTAFTLVMIDVDRFKLFNDSQGHRAGDECLHLIGGVLGGFARRPDEIAARYGGEEFCLVLTETSGAKLHAHLDSLRQAIIDIAIPHPASEFGVVTVSIGFAVAQRGEPVSTLIERADRSLYEAKSGGRNRIHGVVSDAASQITNSLQDWHHVA